VDAAGNQVGALRPAAAGATSLVVTGLTNGTAYRFQVSATNIFGTSLYSALSNAVTPAGGDIIAPTVTARTPGINATGVAVATNVLTTFSENVNGVSGTTVTLRNTATNALIPAAVTYNAVTRVATLDPTVNLTNNTQYTVTLTGGAAAIRDIAGNPLVTTSWNFTTVAVVNPPTLTARTPAINAVGVARASNVTATFSRFVQGVNTTTMTLQQVSNNAVVPGTVAFNFLTNIATLNPTPTLLPNTQYRVTLTGGPAAIRDLLGVPFTTTTWTFTTGP
jgi:hypothetical protein